MAAGHVSMTLIVEGNAGDLGESQAVEALIKATKSELSRYRERLDRRADAGFVRRCHGDLHLGNIFLDGNRLVLFDYLEFDEALATIDVFYDLAFLLMDLCHRDLDPLAIDLLNAYLERTEDDDGAALLPLFLAIRATIRAKIEGFEIRIAGSMEDASRHRFAIVQYINLAISFQGTWLDAPKATLEHRIVRRRRDVSDADLDILARQRERDIVKMSWKVVDASGDADRIAARVQAFIAGHDEQVGLY